MTEMSSQSVDYAEADVASRCRNQGGDVRTPHQITHTLHQNRSTRRPRAKHRRMQSEPFPSALSFAPADTPFTSDPSPSPSDQSSGEGWTEIDESVGGPSTDLPSSPNGYSAAGMGRSQSSGKLASNEHRAQLVIRSMTDKIFSRRRIIRRVPSDEDLTDTGSSSPETKRTKERQSDVRGLPWKQSSGSTAKTSSRPATSTLTASPTLLGSRVRGLFVRRHSRDPDAEVEQDSPDNLPVTRGKRTRSPSIASSTGLQAYSGRAPDNNVDLDEGMDDVAVSAFPPAPPSSPEVQARVLHAMLPKPANDDILVQSTAAPRPSTSSTGTQLHAEAGTKSAARMCVTPGHLASSDPQITVATRDLPQTGTDSPGQLYPHDTLTNNIARFMRFSSAVYGDSFLRLLGLSQENLEFPSNGGHHANTWAFVSAASYA